MCSNLIAQVPYGVITYNDKVGPTPLVIPEHVRCATCTALINGQDPTGVISIPIEGNNPILILTDFQYGTCKQVPNDCIQETGCSTTGNLFVITDVPIVINNRPINPPGEIISINILPIISCGENDKAIIYDRGMTKVISELIYTCGKCDGPIDPQ